MQFWDPAQKVETFVMPHLSVRRFPSCVQGDTWHWEPLDASPQRAALRSSLLSSHTAWDTHGDTLLLLTHVLLCHVIWLISCSLPSCNLPMRYCAELGLCLETTRNSLGNLSKTYKRRR